MCLQSRAIPEKKNCKGALRAWESRLAVVSFYWTAPQYTVQDADFSRTPSSYVAGSSPTTILPAGNLYPNPGYLGSSSHVAIFNHINSSGDAGTEPHTSTQIALSASGRQSSIDLDRSLDQVAELLKQVHGTFTLASMNALVVFWLGQGMSLALAEPFVRQCLDSTDEVHARFPAQDANWHVNLTRHLLQNSGRPLNHKGLSRLSDFTNQFCGLNIRLETLGIYFAAVARASIEFSFFYPLYASEADRIQLQTLATRLNDRILDVCLSLDCPNDIQLIFQYENWILHSYTDGDQSLQAWRRLGDAIASAFALGYHEDLQTKADVPSFLVELRRMAFARLYSGDKNVAIFLGRPPRMSKRFCQFQIPSSSSDLCHTSLERSGCIEDWDPDATFSYRAETRWSALCASIKEDILDLSTNLDRHSITHAASEIAHRVESHWQALPAHFRLHGSLKQCTGSPFECDFLVSTRLNHLHVKFLLRLLSLRGLTEPDEPIIAIAEEMLALVVEAILSRDRLSNSGTGLLWKVAHYGLPAAGMILIAILKQGQTSKAAGWSRGRVWQHLSIFVGEIQMGSVVKPGEPNYALFSKATHIIQKFLDSVGCSEATTTGDTLTRPPATQVADETSSQADRDLWCFDFGLWESLSEHPFLPGADPTFQFD